MFVHCDFGRGMTKCTETHAIAHTGKHAHVFCCVWGVIVRGHDLWTGGQWGWSVWFVECVVLVSLCSEVVYCNCVGAVSEVSEAMELM